MFITSLFFAASIDHFHQLKSLLVLALLSSCVQVSSNLQDAVSGFEPLKTVH